jgi:hypothetical protein
MDTLTIQVLLRCMITNSRKASVSIVAGTVLRKGKQYIEYRVSPRQSVSEVSLRQSASGIRVSQSVAKVSLQRVLEMRHQRSAVPSMGSKKLPVPVLRFFSIIVICCSCNLHSE